MAFDSYRFPAVETGPGVNSAAAEEVGAVFQPMFRAAPAAEFTPRALQEPVVTQAERQAAARRQLEEQLKLQEGLTAGRLAGVLRAQQELAPDLENFLEARALLSSRLEELADVTAGGIVDLAAAVSHAILGAEKELYAAKLASVAAGLQNSLRVAGETTLQLAVPDLARLEAVARANNLGGPVEMPGIKLRSTTGLHEGVFRLQGAALDPQEVIGRTLGELRALLEESAPMNP